MSNQGDKVQTGVFSPTCTVLYGVKEETVIVPREDQVNESASLIENVVINFLSLQHPALHCCTIKMVGNDLADSTTQEAIFLSSSISNLASDWSKIGDVARRRTT